MPLFLRWLVPKNNFECLLSKISGNKAGISIGTTASQKSFSCEVLGCDLCWSHWSHFHIMLFMEHAVSGSYLIILYQLHRFCGV
jgi:hypothetical protein